VPFTEEWLPSGHSTINGVIGGVLQKRLSFRKVLPSPQRNSGVLSECPSGSWSPPWLKPFSPIAQFGRAASSRKSLAGSKLLPFKNDGGHCVVGDLQGCRHFLAPFPRSVPQHNPRGSTDNSFDLMAWFLLWHALSTVGPYIDRWVPFQIMFNQLNLPQVDYSQVVETSRMINGNRVHLSSISSLIAKGLNTHVNKVFFIFNIFANISKKLFFSRFFHCRLMRIFIYLIHFRKL
jgi:hypothetical protein